jgi:hypothetical protein
VYSIAVRSIFTNHAVVGIQTGDTSVYSSENLAAKQSFKIYIYPLEFEISFEMKIF